MIFVTGGTGLVGAHLLYVLTSSGKQVKALKRETSNLKQVLITFSYYTNKADELFNRIEWVDGDILDYFSLENILKGVTEIYHCAAIVSFNPGDREKMITNNIEGTANIVNAAIENGVKKLCHVSSVAALGRSGNDLPITEETNWVPSKRVSGYSESKFFSETEVWRGMEEGLDAVIVNPSIILGPANWESGSARMFKTVHHGIKFYTLGTTGYVAVNDVANAMLLLMDEKNFETAKNQRYLLSAENINYRDVFFMMADALEKPRPRYAASKLMLNIAWRASKVAGFLTAKVPAVTREIAANAMKVNIFDGSKITRMFAFEYHPISEVITKTAGFLKHDSIKS